MVRCLYVLTWFLVLSAGLITPGFADQPKNTDPYIEYSTIPDDIGLTTYAWLGSDPAVISSLLKQLPDAPSSDLVRYLMIELLTRYPPSSDPYYSRAITKTRLQKLAAIKAYPELMGVFYRQTSSTQDQLAMDILKYLKSSDQRDLFCLELTRYGREEYWSLDQAYLDLAYQCAKIVKDTALLELLIDRGANPKSKHALPSLPKNDHMSYSIMNVAGLAPWPKQIEPQHINWPIQLLAYGRNQAYLEENENQWQDWQKKIQETFSEHDATKIIISTKLYLWSVLPQLAANVPEMRPTQTDLKSLINAPMTSAVHLTPIAPLLQEHDGESLAVILLLLQDHKLQDLPIMTQLRILESLVYMGLGQYARFLVGDIYIDTIQQQTSENDT